MAKKQHTTTQKQVTEILKVSTGGFDCCLVGRDFVCNRVSEKAKRELLFPNPRVSGIRTTLKHVPVDEFRASPYLLKDPSQPTLLAMLSSAFHKAIANATLDMSAKKTEIYRRMWIEGDKTNIYGVPKLWMTIVRSADMNRTPDVRTRARLPEWACRLRITFVEPLIKAQALVNLLASAGLTIGVGDGRQEKGSGMHCGNFRIVGENDADFKRIVKEGGRKAQQAALDHPVAYDDETLELLTWFDTELERRRKAGAPQVESGPVAHARAVRPNGKIITDGHQKGARGETHASAAR